MMKTFFLFFFCTSTIVSFAKSNIDSIITPNICAVSVDTFNVNDNLIYWQNTDTNITQFIIYRKNKITHHFDSIAKVQAKEFNKFVDANSQYPPPSSYKIQALNDSGSRGEVSAEVQSIFFSALEIVDDSVVRLDWSTVPGTVNDSIIIWRRNMEPNYNLVKKLSITDSMYLDTISWAFWLIEYRLEIIKTEPCFLSSDSLNKLRVFANATTAHFAAISNKHIQELQVFPNPVSNVLKFNFINSLFPAKLKIYNSQGQLQQQSIIYNNELDVKNLLDGFYYFILETNEMYYKGSFVKFSNR